MVLFRQIFYENMQSARYLNPGPAEPGYTLPLKMPTDLDLHCLPLSM